MVEQERETETERERDEGRDIEKTGNEKIDIE